MKKPLHISTNQSHNRLLTKLVSRLLKAISHFLTTDQHFQSIEKEHFQFYVLVISIHIFVSQVGIHVEYGEKISSRLHAYIFNEVFSSPYLLDYKILQYAVEVFEKPSPPVQLTFLNDMFNNLDNFSLLDLVSNCLGLLPEISTSRHEHGIFYTPASITSFIIDHTFNLFVYNNYPSLTNCPTFNKETSIEENYVNLTQQLDKKGILDLLLTTPVIDPAVGAGYFFVSVLDLIGRLIQNFIAGLPPLLPDERNKKIFFKNFIAFVMNYCYGFDIDISALLVARIRMFLLLIKWLYAYDKNFLVMSLTGLTLPQHFVLLDTLFTDIPVPQGKYIVVGNPPWGAKINTTLAKLKTRYTVATRQFDTWSIFLERMIELLPNQSILGVIIPNTLLNNPNYKDIRALILEKTLIVTIINLGDAIFDHVNQPVMILILQKTLPHHPPLTRVLDSITNEQRSRLKNHQTTLWDKEFVYKYTNQLVWKQNSHLDFQIFTLRYEDFLTTIEKNAIPLKELVKNSRGVEIGKKGKVVLCPQCQSFNPPFGKNIFQKLCPKCGFLLISNTVKTESIITEDIPDPSRSSVPLDTSYHPIFLGQHIHRFYANSPSYIHLGYGGINYKKETDYLGPKILLAKTGHALAFYVDETHTYTLQVVYIFHIKELYLKYYSYYALVGILNSAILYTYYYTKYADINRKQFPHFIQTRILDLPLPVSTLANQELFLRISNLGKSLQTYYTTLHNLKEKYLASISLQDDYLQINFFDFCLEYHVLAGSFKDTINQSVLEKIFPDLYINLDKDNILDIGSIKSNEFISLIKIKFVSPLIALISFLTLYYQKNSLRKSLCSIKDLFRQRIVFFVPKLAHSDKLDLWYQEKFFANNITSLHQSYDHIQSLLVSELLLNELLLQLYQLNDLKYKEMLLYPFFN